MAAQIYVDFFFIYFLQKLTGQKLRCYMWTDKLLLY